MAISATPQLDIDLISALKSTQASRSQALSRINSFISKYNSQTRTLLANAANYSLDYVSNRVIEIESTVKTLNKIVSGISKIDPNDAILPKLTNLKAKLVKEFNVLVGQIKNKVADYKQLHKNVVSAISNLQILGKTPPKAASNTADETLKADLKGGVSQFLPPDAAKVFKSSNSTKSSPNVSYNRSGVAVVNKNAQPSRGEREYAAAVTRKSQKDSKFWGDFSERLDVHFEKIEKYLKEIAENGGMGGGGHGGISSNIMGMLKDIVTFKVFKDIFKGRVFSSLRKTSRGVLGNSKILYDSVKAPNTVPEPAKPDKGKGLNLLDEDSINAAKKQISKTSSEFNGFVSNRMKLLQDSINESWNKTTSNLEKQLGSLVEGIKSGGSTVGKALEEYKSTIYTNLGDVKSNMLKWGGETLSGFEGFNKKFVEVANSIKSGVNSFSNKALDSTLNSINKGYDGVKSITGKGRDLLSEMGGKFSNYLEGLKSSYAETTIGRVSSFAGKAFGRASKFVSKAAPLAAPVVGGLTAETDLNRLKDTTTDKDRINNAVANLNPFVSGIEAKNFITNHTGNTVILPGQMQRLIGELVDSVTDTFSGSDRTDKANKLAASLFRGDKVDTKDLGQDTDFLNTISRKLAVMSDFQNTRGRENVGYDPSLLPNDLKDINTPWGMEAIKKAGLERSLNEFFVKQSYSGTNSLNSYLDSVKSGKPLDSISANNPEDMKKIAEVLNAARPSPDVNDLYKGYERPKQQQYLNLPKEPQPYVEPDTSNFMPIAYKPDTVIGDRPNYYQRASYSDGASSSVGTNNTNAIVVRIADDSIRDLALLLYTLLTGKSSSRPKSGGLLQKASFTAGGDLGSSSGGGGGFGLGGGSNNSALGGGGFGGSFSGGGGFGAGGSFNSGMGGGGGNGGGGLIVGGRRIGGRGGNSGSSGSSGGSPGPSYDYFDVHHLGSGLAASPNNPAALGTPSINTANSKSNAIPGMQGPHGFSSFGMNGLNPGTPDLMGKSVSGTLSTGGLTGPGGIGSGLKGGFDLNPNAASGGVGGKASSALTNDKGHVISTSNTDMTPQARAFLDTIAAGESKHYNDINYAHGGGQFSGYDDHPFAGQKGSTSAGRYMDLASTWSGIAKKYNLKDFSPNSQDIGNWGHAQDVYRRKTGGDLKEALNKKEYDKIYGALGDQEENGRGYILIWVVFMRRI